MNFDQAFDRLISNEGGYVNNPADPGGETNWGISKRSYPDVDIANLTREGAKAIYLRDFWQRGQMDQYDPAIASGFGTLPSCTVCNNTAAFEITVGSGGTDNQGQLTFPAAPNGWACSANAAGSQGFGFIEQMNPISTTQVLVSNINATTGSPAAWAVGDTIQFQCTAF